MPKRAIECHMRPRSGTGSGVHEQCHAFLSCPPIGSKVELKLAVKSRDQVVNKFFDELWKKYELSNAILKHAPDLLWDHVNPARSQDS